MKVTYIFPSRSRPAKFFKCLDNIHSLSESDNFEVIAVLDTDDEKMNLKEIKDKIEFYPKVRYYFGVSTGKIDAVNRELDKISTDTEIVCLESDDFIFTKQGFDNDIREVFADGFRGLAHFPDKHVNKKLITYPIMHIDYLKRFGYIYHPDYFSVRCDSEQMEVAELLGQYKYVDKQIMEHLHYRWNLDVADELMKINENSAMYRHDKLVYTKRKLINFGL